MPATSVRQRSSSKAGRSPPAQLCARSELKEGSCESLYQQQTECHSSGGPARLARLRKATYSRQQPTVAASSFQRPPVSMPQTTRSSLSVPSHSNKPVYACWSNCPFVANGCPTPRLQMSPSDWKKIRWLRQSYGIILLRITECGPGFAGAGGWAPRQPRGPAHGPVLGRRLAPALGRLATSAPTRDELRAVRG